MGHSLQVVFTFPSSIRISFSVITTTDHPHSRWRLPTAGLPPSGYSRRGYSTTAVWALTLVVLCTSSLFGPWTSSGLFKLKSGYTYPIDENCSEIWTKFQGNFEESWGVYLNEIKWRLDENCKKFKENFWKKNLSKFQKHF